MDGMSRYIDVLAHQVVNPPAEGDQIKDGILYCGKCGEPKQCRLVIAGEEKIVPCVCRCRQEKLQELEQERQEAEQRRIIQGLRIASLMSGKYREATFERFFRRPENEKQYGIAKRYVENFDSLKEMNCGLLFYGPVGSGKSFTAACIANALLEEGRSVIMTSFVKLLQDFWQDGAESRFVAMMEKAALVIMDDFGAERYTEFALEKVYNIIDSRVRADLPLIVTTNISEAEMKAETEIRYRRIYDRIFENCYPVEFSGSSFRALKSRAKKNAVQSILEDKDGK